MIGKNKELKGDSRIKKISIKLVKSIYKKLRNY